MSASSSRDHGLKLKLGDAPVDLVSIEADEGLSTHFSIVLTVLSKLDDFDLLASLGKPGVVTVTHGDETVRHFHGHVSEGEQIDGVLEAGQLYKVKLSPLALFHDQGRNFRIFQGKSVEEIVTIVLDECGIKFKIKATGGSRKRAYCVQYGESDFAFVSRLMEEHGLYYYYNHSTSSHELTICDQVNQIVDSPVKDLRYNPEATSISDADLLAGADKGFLFSFTEVAASNGIAKVTFRDFDFKAPNSAREAHTEQPTKHDIDRVEFFEWPGRFYVPAEGTQLTKLRIEAMRAQRLTYKGQASTAGVCVGHKISITEHDVDRFNDDFHIISSSIRIDHNSYRSSTGNGQSYINFVAIPLDTQFRAPMITPRPIVSGPETAIVTGPTGEEIHVDEWGRVKIHFHWDRIGLMNDTCSCWVRVSQTGGLGNIIHPRVGQEVLVEFISGDPDRPIVVGRVYNEGNKPIYTLPADKTRSVWRTKTYKQTVGSSYDDACKLETGAPAANEIRFEDATGKEEVFIHAEKDLNTRIRHFETHKVGGDATIWIGKNRSEEVLENEKIWVGKDRTEEVINDEDLTVGHDRKRLVKHDETVDISNDQKITAGNEITITAGSKITLVCGGSMVEITPNKISLTTTTFETTASAEASITAGGQAKYTAGGKIAITAPMVNIN